MPKYKFYPATIYVSGKPTLKKLAMAYDIYKKMYRFPPERVLLTEKQWDEYDWGEVILTLPSVSPEKVKEYYKKAFRQFYFRPKYILRTFFKIRTKN